MGQHLAGEFDDRGLSRDVAADGDIPLRLVAFAPTGPDLRETEPNAGRSHPEGEELSNLHRDEGTRKRATGGISADAALCLSSDCRGG